MSLGSAVPSARYRSSAPLTVPGSLPLFHTAGAEPADQDILIPLPPYLNAQECSPTYMASARHYFYLKFRSIFAHQNHMLRRVKCTRSAHNEEHLGAHNLSPLLNCPEPCEYVYLCYGNTGNTILLSRFLIYVTQPLVYRAMNIRSDQKQRD